MPSSLLRNIRFRLALVGFQSAQLKPLLSSHGSPAPHNVRAEVRVGAATPPRGILGLKFRRQQVLHGFIVDFYCVAERLVLELEGDAHDGSDERTYDAARAKVLQAAGYRVVRIRNKDVTRERLEALVRHALQRTSFVPPLPKGEGDRG